MSYIAIEAAKNAIMNCITEQTVSKYATSAECKAARHGADLALFSLDAVPTADVVEVRHGEWKKLYDTAPRYVCTACNHFYNNREYKFCPNCGAKMDGEKEIRK